MNETWNPITISGFILYSIALVASLKFFFCIRKCSFQKSRRQLIDHRTKEEQSKWYVMRMQWFHKIFHRIILLLLCARTWNLCHCMAFAIVHNMISSVESKIGGGISAIYYTHTFCWSEDFSRLPTATMNKPHWNDSQFFGIVTIFT